MIGTKIKKDNDRDKDRDEDTHRSLPRLSHRDIFCAVRPGQWLRYRFA